MAPKAKPKIDIKMFGKRIKANDIKEFAGKLRMNQTNAKKVIANLNRRTILHDPANGQYVEVDKTHYTPLIMRHLLDTKTFTKAQSDKILLNAKVDRITKDTNIRPLKTKFKPEDKILNRITLNVRLVISSTDGTLEQGSARSCFIKPNIQEGERVELRPKYSKPISVNDNADIDTGLYLSTAGELKEMVYKHLIVYNTKDIKSRYYINERRMTEKSLRTGRFYKMYIDDNTRNPDMQTLDYTAQPAIIKAMLDKMYNHYCVKGGITFCILESISLNGSLDQSNQYNETKMMMFKALDISDISTNLYNEIIDIPNNDENCVVATLTKLYPVAYNAKKYFLKVSPDYEKKGISTDEIYDFCVEKKIQMLCYDIGGNLIKSHIPVKPSKFKSLCYIQYNEHMYLIKNRKLNKKIKNNLPNQLKTSSELNNMFYDLLEKKVIPADVRISNISVGNKPLISSFIHDDVYYFSNDDYLLCERLLEALGAKHLMTPYINKYNLITTLEELYNITNVKSFFPQLVDHSFDLLLYKSEYFNNLSEEEIEALNPIIFDKSKAYGNALERLPEILTVDIRHMPKIKYTDEPIHQSYVYYIIPTYHTVLIPNAIYASGYDILYYQSRDISFSIIHYYEAIAQPNPYKNLINDFYTKAYPIAVSKQEKDNIKQIINIFIGKMEHVDKVTSNILVKKICNKTEALLSTGMNTKLNDSNHLIWEEHRNMKKSSIYTGKLTKCLLLNMHRRMIFEKMEDMNVCESRLIYLKTDAICFIPREEDKHLYTTESDDYKGWKQEPYKPFICENQYELRTFVNTDKTVMNNNVLYNCYAGTGKSYLIKNRIIKKIEEEGKTYIVLTPSHSSIMEYRREGYINAVIQTFDYTTDLPKYDVVIIDELGMCSTSANSMLWRFMCVNPSSQIIACGDFKQLIPPRDQLSNQPDYLNIMFPRHRNLKVNHRNNFTIPYYDSLINESIPLNAEIRKYNTPMKDAEYIILPTNIQIEAMNKYLLDKKGLTMYSEGLEVMCKTNKLRDHDIYNNYKLFFDSLDEDDDMVYLHDDVNEYKITKKQYDSNFQYSRCRTLYNCQGMTIKSYHIPNKYISYFGASGRFAYTLISRLKQDIIKPIEIKEKVMTTNSTDMTTVNFDEL
jgi:hypothetical protein